MKLNKICIENFRCFKKIETEFQPDINVIIGNNGVGKTSILDAISIGIGSLLLSIDGISAPSIKKEDAHVISYEIGSTIDRQPQYPVSISCVGSMNSESVQWSRKLLKENGKTTTGEALAIREISADWQKKIRSGDKNVALPLISYYSTGRLWMQKRERQDNSIQIVNRFQGYTDCLSAMSNEKLMLKWFEKMTLIELQEQRTLPELSAVKKAIEECYSESGTKDNDIKVYFNIRSHQLEIQYCNENGEWHKHPFHELSDGYRNTLSLVADIAYRMALLNPQYLDDVLKKTNGIILIDEIDLHLHPVWQKNILKTLHRIFPCVQFIVTTHSPSVISSAKKEQLLILNGEECYSYQYEVYGKDVNSVLFEIMGTPARPDDIEQKLVQFNTCLDNDDLETAEKILAELRNLLGNHNNDVISGAVALDFMKD